MTRELNVPVINQDNGNLIPFTFVGESGISVDLQTDSILQFVVEPSNTSAMDYTAIINRDNSALTNDTTTEESVYVPEDDETYYEHRSEIYVDVIGDSSSGIKKVRTHVEPNKYEFEDVEDSFLIPQFTWDNSIFSSNTVTTTTTGFVDGSFWAGTENSTFHKVKYGSNVVSLQHSANVSSQVTGLYFAPNTNKLYVSTDANLYSYTVDTFLEGINVGQDQEVANDGDDIIGFYDTSNVWSTQAYNGNVRELDPSDLSQVSIVQGFDSPFKIIKSSHHDSYFVAGDHILWRIDSGVVTAFYEVNDYSIMDFDVSESGKVCLLLNGINEDIIRILDYDLYSFILNQSITDSSLRYCKYCQEGRFYILSEIAQEDVAYVSYHYLFDINTGTLNKTTSSEVFAETTTTTTIGTTNKPIQIIYPNGGESLQIGETYTISWLSNKALNDAVKIELYKGGSFYSLITESTQNSGVYVWGISPFIPESTDYKIVITWLSANNDPENKGTSSEEFSIAKTVSTTTTTTTQIISQKAIGIDYDKDRDYVVFALRSGLFGVYDLSTKVVYGLFSSGIVDLSAMAIGDDFIGLFDRQSRVRVFVGSQERTSDKWDSGEITTSLTSMYYGGGNNLLPGKKYYVTIQVYSDKYGWGEPQTKEFIMPKGE